MFTSGVVIADESVVFFFRSRRFPEVFARATVYPSKRFIAKFWGREILGIRFTFRDKSHPWTRN